MTLIRGSSSPIFTAGCWINTFSASEKKKTTTQHSTKLLLKKQRAIKSQENERELRNTPRGNLTLGMEPIDTCGYYYSKIPHTFWNQHEIWFTHFLRLWITTGVWPGRQQNSVLEARTPRGRIFLSDMGAEILSELWNRLTFRSSPELESAMRRKTGCCFCSRHVF